MSKRIDWIDAAKGFLIILVILGHSNVSELTMTVINSFHMAAFFALSGVTFKGNSKFSDFLWKKVKNLLLPYVFFSGLFLAYQYVLTTVFAGRVFDLWSGLQSIVLPVSGRTATTVYGLWFLPCLFLAEIVFYWIARLGKTSAYLSIGGFLFVLFGCALFHTFSGVTSIISVLPIAVLFMAYGGWGYRNIAFVENNKLWLLLCADILFCISTGSNYLLYGHRLDLSSLTLGFAPLYLLSGAAGTVIICILSMLMSGCMFLKKLGCDSLYYYGLHYEVIGLMEKALRGGVLQTIGVFCVLIPVVQFLKKLEKSKI